MKTTLRGLLSLLVILLPYVGVQAQYYEVAFTEKVDSADLIIEGKIIESTSFESNGEVFTCHKLQALNSIYPLTPPCGSSLESEEPYCVYIITLGGKTENRIERWSHSLTLHKEDMGLFILSNTLRPKLYTDVPSYEVYSGYQGFIRYETDEAANFKGRDLLNTYTNPDELIEYVYQILGLNQSNKSFIRDDWALSLLIDNLSLVGNSVSFDVSMKALWGNEFKPKDLSFRMLYDTTLFGKNILTHNTGSFTISSGMNAAGVSLTTTQITENTVSARLLKTNPSSGSLIANSYEKLFSVSLTLQDTVFEALPDLQIVTSSISQKITEENNNEIVVDKSFIHVDSEGIQSCSLNGQIDSVEPLDVGAGVRQENSLVFDASSKGGIITIKGCGFGDLDENNLSAEIPYNYRVEFQAAESNNRISPFASDYILWNDDEIQVKVPSVGYRVNFFGIDDQPVFDFLAGNGTVRVRIPGLFNNIDSEQELTVSFAHWNAFVGDNTTEHEAIRYRLKAFDHVDSGNMNDGYEFFFTQAFTSNMPSGSPEAVTAALEQWACETRVNFDIVNEVDIEDPNGFGSGQIDWGNVEAGLIADSKTVLDNTIVCSNENDVPPSKLGVIFSNSRTFSTNGSPSNGEYDVESIALHEIGHNVTLAHVDDNESIMFPNTNSGSSSVDRTLDNADISGGQHVVGASTELINCPGELPPMVPLTCTNSTNNFITTPNFIFITPNPNNGFFTIKTKDGSLMEEILLFSITGQKLYEFKQINKPAYTANLPLTKGIYLVSGKTNQGFYFADKIIISE